VTDFNRRTIEEFHANGGRVGGVLAGIPLILIHHVGARSGKERVTPLAYWRCDDDTFAVVASNGGSATHPAWYHNLKAQPRITVEVGTETFSAHAEELVGVARSRLWLTLVAAWPDLAAFDSTTERSIPLFLLRRVRRDVPPVKDEGRAYEEARTTARRRSRSA
jgi:deazaflavin-dependent oxidoreductase (nitroreductase family)